MSRVTFCLAGAAAALSLSLLATPARAQVVLGPPIVSPDFGGVAGPNSTAVTDLDHDGHMDLLYPAWAGDIVVAFGDGAGHFGAPQPTTPTTDSGTLAVADLDGDGLVERITAPRNVQPLDPTLFPPFELHVSRGLGGTAFAAPDVYTLAGSSGMISFGHVTIRDVDGDGDLDVFVLVNDGSNGAGVHTAFNLLLNDGTGALTLQVMGGGEPTMKAEAADLNLDGLPDLIYYTAGPAWPFNWTPYTHVRLAQPGGGFVEVANWETQLIGVADLNADGLPDIVSWSWYEPSLVSKLETRLNLGDGTFASTPTFQAICDKPLAVADLDGDAYPDLLVMVGGGEPSYGAVSNDGTGGFDLKVMARANREHTEFVVLADAVTDGRLDILVSEYVIGGTSIFSTIPNLTYPASAPAHDLARSKSGSAGWPGTLAASSFTAGQPLTIDLWNAGANKTAFLVTGLTEGFTPFKGGTMVPHPDLVFGPMSTGSGELHVHSFWPVGFPAGTAVTLQWWMLDPGATKGAASSSAVRIVGG